MFVSRPTQFYTTHLPVERSFGVIIVKVDPVEEQLFHDRVVHVRVVPEHLEAGEDLEVVKEVGVFCIKPSCDGEHARCVQEHVVGVGFLGLQQELKASLEDKMGKTLYVNTTHIKVNPRDLGPHDDDCKQ